MFSFISYLRISGTPLVTANTWGKAISYCCFFCGLLLFVVVAYADTDAERLSRLKLQLQQSERDLKALETSRSDIARELQLLEANQSDIRQAGAILSRQLAAGRQQLAEISARERSLASKRAAYSAHIKRGLMFVTDTSRQMSAMVALTGGGRAEGITTLEILSRVNGSLATRVKELALTIAESNEIKHKIAQTNIELDTYLADIKHLSAELTSQTNKLATRRAQLSRDAVATKAYIDRLRASQASIDSAINQSQKLEIRKDGGNSRLPDSDFARLKGKLPVPMRGVVVERFGERVEDGTRVKIAHKGVRLRPSVGGGEVRAVFNGRVAYVNNLAGVGNIIIVQHDPIYYTVYANLDEFYVNAGDDVQRGEQLGLISTEFAQNLAYLYFEIRQREQALNPENWLAL
ncbi:peptidoglycan DD-metalloendopeptidase family protein [Deferribacterales bacterium RsTz2092]|nr:peptidase M23 [Deferribacterales bacterium]